MRFAICAAAVAFVLPGPALAEWQYARWGMTPDQLVSASGGQAARIEGRPGQRVFDLDYLAAAPSQAGSIPVEAQFYFSRGSRRLAAVKLVPADPADCDALPRDVEALHGGGTEERFPFGRSVQWQDEANGNHLLFADINPVGRLRRMCHLIYRPLAAGAGR